jgi:hypothetical protein
MLCLSLVLVLSCNMMSTPVGTQPPDPSVEETDIALRVMSTSLAIQQMTLEAAQAQMTQQAGSVPPTEPAQPTQTTAPTQTPVQEIQPSPVPSNTPVPPPAALVLEIQKSLDTFYCYQFPYELTISVKVSDINRGMAVYYHIRDKLSGVMSEDQVIDLHRQNSDTRSAVIIGGGSSRQNLQFPPMMGESYFVYQIISDDGKFRSPVYSDITFFPCGQ